MMQEYIDMVMNASDEKIERLFADMGIEIKLNKPFFVDVDEEILEEEFEDEEDDEDGWMKEQHGPEKIVLLPERKREDISFIWL